MDDKRSNKKPSITVRPCDNGDALGPRRRQRSWSVEVDGEVVSDHETRREARDEADARREEARLEADRLLRDAEMAAAEAEEDALQPEIDEAIKGCREIDDERREMLRASTTTRNSTGTTNLRRA